MRSDDESGQTHHLSNSGRGIRTRLAARGRVAVVWPREQAMLPKIARLRAWADVKRLLAGLPHKAFTFHRGFANRGVRLVIRPVSRKTPKQVYDRFRQREITIELLPEGGVKEKVRMNLARLRMRAEAMSTLQRAALRKPPKG